MIATTHMLVGAAAGVKAGSVPRAVAAGALTHLLLDAVPHRDYRRGRALGGLVLADVSAGAVTAWSLSGGSRPALAGALGGLLPDALRAGEKIAGIGFTSAMHDASHSDRRPAKRESVAIQGAIMLVGGALLIRTNRRWRLAGGTRRARLVSGRRSETMQLFGNLLRVLSGDRNRCSK
jgi:hypothetical protein